MTETSLIAHVQLRKRLGDDDSIVIRRATTNGVPNLVCHVDMIKQVFNISLGSDSYCARGCHRSREAYGEAYSYPDRRL